MPRDMTVSDSVTIAAPAEEIWTAVADPSQMPRWSPENVRGYVATPGSPLAVGDSFVGANKRGRARWQTRCVVTTSEPGRAFAFDVVQIGPRRPLLKAPIATWTYTFESAADGTETVVHESWADGRQGWPDRVAAVFDKVVTGGQLFADFQRQNIARTLAALKTDFESGAAA